MNFENLFQNHDKLIQHMKDAGYAESYIRLLKTEITWLQKNGDSVDSYETACQIRQGQTNLLRCSEDTGWSMESLSASTSATFTLITEKKIRSLNEVHTINSMPNLWRCLMPVRNQVFPETLSFIPLRGNFQPCPVFCSPCRKKVSNACLKSVKKMRCRFSPMLQEMYLFQTDTGSRYPWP